MTNILLVGLNHKTTPVQIRERLAFSPAQVGDALVRLMQPDNEPGTQLLEAAILSTCNRVEIYAVCENIENGARRLESFLSNYHNVPPDAFRHHLNRLSNLGAVEHLFSVACGLESMIVGEAQIQGQVKQALEWARQYGTAGTLLSTLFENALRAGKRARSETQISRHSLSISGAAVNLVRTAFADLANLKIVVVGLGEMGLIALKTLFQLGAQDVSIINRRPERVGHILQDLPVRATGFENFEQSLALADVVICSTAAPHAVLTFDMMKKVRQQRAKDSLLVIDIAVPRDVEPAVGTLPGVRLCNIDHLKARVEQNLERRCDEMSHVRSIIVEEVDAFRAWHQSLKAKPVIAKLRQRMESIREQELSRALRKLKTTLSEKDAEVIHDLSRRIVNKILHQPVTRLRAEAAAGNGDVYAAAIQSLFNLEEYPANREQK